MTPRLRLPFTGIRPPAARERSLRRVRLALARRLSVRLLLVLAAVLLPCATAVGFTPRPVPSDSARASATPEPSLAGTVAGEGRTRPGRPQGPATKIEGQDPDDPDEPDEPDDSAARDTPDAPGTSNDSDDHGGLGEGAATEPAGSGAGSPAADSAQPPREAVLAPTSPQPHQAGQAMGSGQEDDNEPMLHVLPLGSGLVLIGLGLGLAFVGLRVRRG
ncbi:hypothetical protein ACIRBZ_10865 [Streptomyces sp. NPDC094038]|uniref:hypothetical protein n=1 Tax=Streptomyces sp. NPDC094038 TaxID=3366055 RepID=UPI003805D958